MFSFNLLPKENKFNVLLKDLAAQAGDCAHHLKIFVDSDDKEVRLSAAQSISETRDRAKDLAAAMTRELCQTFVTPFDREDIQAIAENLYRIPKTIEKVKDRMLMHDLGGRHEDFVPQTDLIVMEADAMVAMVDDLVSGKNGQKVQDRVALFYDLENQGDKILGELLVTLFKNSGTNHDLILRKDIYDMLEKIIDRYRDAAGVALQMVLKHT